MMMTLIGGCQRVETDLRKLCRIEVALEVLSLEEQTLACRSFSVLKI